MNARIEAIETERLSLRLWHASDFAPFAAMNADSRVREFFPTTLTREQSDASIRSFQVKYANDGFGLLAAELRDTKDFVGIVGVQVMDFAVPGVPQPVVEIGWRLAYRFWGNGLATEGAQAVLHYALHLHISPILAITVPANIRSRRVMEKIGMHYVSDGDFDHPGIAAGHPLRRHVLYSCTDTCL